MTKDQAINLVQTIGKVVGAILATHGATQAQTNYVELFVGVATTVVSWWFSHQSAGPTPPAAG